MNWNRGFFRVWLVLSLAWIGLIGLMGFLWGAAGLLGGKAGAADLLGTMVVPPVGLFVAGFAILWALAGFRKS
jgi:hypothetical protein